MFCPEYYLRKTHHKRSDCEQKRIRPFPINEIGDFLAEQPQSLCIMVIRHVIHIPLRAKGPVSSTLRQDQLQQQITGEGERDDLHQKWIDRG